jgi:hypothetical protein
VLVDDPLLAAALAEATPVPVVLAVALGAAEVVALAEFEPVLVEVEPVPVALAAVLGALAEAVFVDDPLLAAALAEATPVPVVPAVALLAGAPFVELLAVPEEVAVLVPPPLEDVLAEEEALAEAERA